MRSNPCSSDITWQVRYALLNHLSLFCWTLRMCVALALFQAARSSGCRPASYAGNTTECTLCASHCPTPGMCWRRRVHTGSVTLLHSSLWPCQTLMLAQLFLHAILLQLCQLCKVSGDRSKSSSRGIIRNPDGKVRPRLKPMNKSTCVRRVNIHFP